MALYDLKIQSVLVEGGAMLLQSFIDAGVWDEARIINNEELTLRQAQGNNGLHAPVLNHGVKIFEQKFFLIGLKFTNRNTPTNDSHK